MYLDVSHECKDKLIPNTFPNIQIKYKSTTKSWFWVVIYVLKNLPGMQ